jgi:hypothetical protein
VEYGTCGAIKYHSKLVDVLDPLATPASFELIFFILSPNVAGIPCYSDFDTIINVVFLTPHLN